jgi:hypothetical protein
VTDITIGKNSRLDHQLELTTCLFHKESSSAPMSEEPTSRKHEHASAGHALGNSLCSPLSGFTVRHSSCGATATVQVAPDQGRSNSTGLHDNVPIHSCSGDINEGEVVGHHVHIKTAADMHAKDVCKPRAHSSTHMQYHENKSRVAAAATVANSATHHMNSFAAVPSYLASAAGDSRGVSQGHVDGAQAHSLYCSTLQQFPNC